MKELSTKKILNIFTLCILFVVPFMKVLDLHLYAFNITNYVDSINPSIVFYFSLPFLIYIYVIDIKVKKRKLNIYDYLFIILVFAGILSSIFAVNPYISIFGKDYRHEGLLSIITYYLLFINWKYNAKDEDVKKYINIIIIIGVINSIYSLFQIYTNVPMVRFADNKFMASGLCGNPNFLGSLMTIVLCFVTTSYLLDDKYSVKKIFLLILFLITLINAQSTGPMLASVLTILFIYLFRFKNIKFKKILSLIMLIIVVVFLVNYTNKTFLKSDTCEICDTKTVIESGGTGRLKIWQNSINIVKKYPILGVGFDNFYLVYPNPKYEGVKISITDSGIQVEEGNIVKIYDNAHNVYLHTLVSTGFLGLIPYLILCLLTFLKGLKFNSKLSIMLFSGFVAYSIQAFFNISVIQVAPIYYLIIGLILSINEEASC